MNKLIIALSAFCMLLSPTWSSAADGQQAASAAPKNHVRLTTNLGDIIIELNAEKAPLSVANFVAYVNKKHYDSTVFHRVIPGFMAQGGGFYRNLNQKETMPPIQNEADNRLKNIRGSVAMARTNDPHSATAQFFINLADNRFLDHTDKSMRGWGYTVFGKVVEGMDVVYQIGDSPTGGRGPFPSDVPLRTITIKSATMIDRK